MLGAQWRAVQREAQLAAEQIAHGVTVLGRANHAQTGLYAQAFFGLSIGLERVGKLVFIADHVMKAMESFPANRDLRRFGHDLIHLLDFCESVGVQLDLHRDHSGRPRDTIHRQIEHVLSMFAVRQRYYNLDYLSSEARGQEDPVAMWWSKVAVPILDRHHSKKQMEKDEEDARAIQGLAGSSMIVEHSAESGELIQSAHDLFAQARTTRVVQKYGRLYTLQIVRWLSSIIFELSYKGGYELGIDAFVGMHEPFSLFLNEDRYLRERKTWSIYRF